MIGALIALAGVPSAAIAEPLELAPEPEARVRLAAPSVSPRQPLPRESILVTGRAGQVRRPVVLESRVATGWRQVRRGHTGDGGRYRFALVAATSAVTYRVVVPAYQGRPRAVSARRTVQLSTARRWWDLNDRCRGSSPPDLGACRVRDDLTKRMGRVVIRDLHQAWRARNYQRVRSLVRYQSDVVWYRNVRPATGFRDCSYTASEPNWLCWVRGTNGHWYSTRFEIVGRSVPGRFHVWRGGALAPDV